VDVPEVSSFGYSRMRTGNQTETSPVLLTGNSTTSRRSSANSIRSRAY
jgi:hypothetical protein